MEAQLTERASFGPLVTSKGDSSTREYDSPGQLFPPNTTNRVTATLWEAEGTLVFHVDVHPEVRVSRREDNNMILASPFMVLGGVFQREINVVADEEDKRHVVYQGPKAFRGLWLPYERALDVANRLGLTERLYPLFSHDIGSWVYRPSTSLAPTPTPQQGYPLSVNIRDNMNNGVEPRPTPVTNERDDRHAIKLNRDLLAQVAAQIDKIRETSQSNRRPSPVPWPTQQLTHRFDSMMLRDDQDCSPSVGGADFDIHNSLTQSTRHEEMDVRSLPLRANQTVRVAPPRPEMLPELYPETNYRNPTHTRQFDNEAYTPTGKQQPSREEIRPDPKPTNSSYYRTAFLDPTLYDCYCPLKQSLSHTPPQPHGPYLQTQPLGLQNPSYSLPKDHPPEMILDESPLGGIDLSELSHAEESRPETPLDYPRPFRCAYLDTRMSPETSRVREETVDGGGVGVDWEEIFGDGGESELEEGCVTPPESPRCSEGF